MFLLSYFRFQDEALHLAWSEDGLAWTPLNGNQAVLRADVGNQSIRDPFLIRGADGLFHLLSTDSWRSPNILHTASVDLIHWQPWEVLPVMSQIPGAENAWAPEAFYDAERQVYLIFWSSVTAGSADQHIWYTETADFHIFSPSKILFDPGYSVIDAVMLQHDQRYWLIYKDERGENVLGTDNKAMRIATSPAPRGPFTPQTGLVTPPLTEGPLVFSVGKKWLMLYDCFMDNRWGASESNDLLHWQPVSGLSVPPDARHGSVISITPDELEQLRAA